MSPLPRFHEQTPEFLVPGDQVVQAIHELGLHTGDVAISCTIPNYRMMLASSAVSDEDGIIPDAYRWHLLVRALPQDQLYPTVPRWMRLVPKGRDAHNRCGVLTGLFAKNDVITIDVPIDSARGRRHTLRRDWPTQSVLDFVSNQWTNYMRDIAKYKICAPALTPQNSAQQAGVLSPAPNGAFA